MSADRANVKWAPFAAVVQGSSMINDVLSKRGKVEMPILSEDQIQVLEEKINEAFHNNEYVKIKYYKDGRFLVKEGKIKRIDKYERKIVFFPNFPLFFSQIVDFC